MNIRIEMQIYKLIRSLASTFDAEHCMHHGVRSETGGDKTR